MANYTQESVPTLIINTVPDEETYEEMEQGGQTAENELYFVADDAGYVTQDELETAIENLTASDVGLGNVDNVKQYSASNPPPYPVTSVNGQTGDVTIQEGSDDLFIVTIDPSTHYPDHSASEIYAARNAGKIVICLDDDKRVYFCNSASSTIASFVNIAFSNKGGGAPYSYAYYLDIYNTTIRSYKEEIPRDVLFAYFDSDSQTIDRSFYELSMYYLSEKIVFLQIYDSDTGIWHFLTPIDATYTDLDLTSMAFGGVIGTKIIKVEINIDDEVSITQTQIITDDLLEDKICRSTAVNESDVNYTTLMARGEKLLDATTFDGVTNWGNQLVNGAIAWKYE